MGMPAHFRAREGMTAAIRPRDWLVPLSTLALAFFLGSAVAKGETPSLDQQLLGWIGMNVTGIARSALIAVYKASGVTASFFLVLTALIHLLICRRWRDFSFLAIATGGILVIVDLLLKPHFDRARPPNALIPLEGHSFPSGHAAGGIVFYFALVAIFSVGHPKRRGPLTLLALAWVALVWFSTLLVRAHWPSDLIAGGAVGVAWLSLCLAWWRSSSKISVVDGRPPC
jgi:undecaprenyl-diphosphatase